MRQLVLEKENSEFKPVKVRLKIDLVSYPARAEGLGKYVSYSLSRQGGTEKEIPSIYLHKCLPPNTHTHTLEVLAKGFGNLKNTNERNDVGTFVTRVHTKGKKKKTSW